MHRYSETKSSPPCSGLPKDPTNRYIKNPQTHPKAYLSRKGLVTGENFTRKVSKSNTLPIQISLIIVKTLGCTTSVGLWFQSLLVYIYYHILFVKDVSYIGINIHNCVCYIVCVQFILAFLVILMIYQLLLVKFLLLKCMIMFMCCIIFEYYILAQY